MASDNHSDFTPLSAEDLNGFKELPHRRQIYGTLCLIYQNRREGLKTALEQLKPSQQEYLLHAVQAYMLKNDPAFHVLWDSYAYYSITTMRGSAENSPNYYMKFLARIGESLISGKAIHESLFDNLYDGTPPSGSQSNQYRNAEHCVQGVFSTIRQALDELGISRSVERQDVASTTKRRFGGMLISRRGDKGRVYDDYVPESLIDGRIEQKFQQYAAEIERDEDYKNYRTALEQMPPDIYSDRPGPEAELSPLNPLPLNKGAVLSADLKALKWSDFKTYSAAFQLSLMVRMLQTGEYSLELLRDMDSSTFCSALPAAEAFIYAHRDNEGRLAAFAERIRTPAWRTAIKKNRQSLQREFSLQRSQTEGMFDGITPYSVRDKYFDCWEQIQDGAQFCKDAKKQSRSHPARSR
jgi:hypothetical protein